MSTADSTIEEPMAPAKTPPQRAGRPWALWFCALAVFILSYLISLLFNLPLETLKTRIEQEVGANAPLKLEIGELSLHWPPGIAARALALRPRDPAVPELQIDELVLTPVWSGLFGETPAVNLGARLLGGAIEGTLAADGRTELQGQGLLLRFDVPQLSGTTLEGIASLRLSTQGALFSSNATASLELNLRDLQAQGLQTLGLGTEALQLGTLSAQLDGRARSFKFEELNLAGPTLQLTGDGSLFVGATPETTRLAMQLKLRPDSGMPASLRDLFLLMPRPGRDGFYNLRVSGTLANPQVK